MQQRLISVLGTLGFAAALVAVPIGIQKNLASLHDHAAFAAGNGGGNGSGNGGGRGNGHGKGRGNGPGPDDSFTVSESSPGQSGSAPGHGGPGKGQAVGHDAVSGVESLSAHQNGLGNLSASNAAPQAFANAAENSMVGAIAAAVKESYVSSDDPNDVINRNEIDLEALEGALAEISNKDIDIEDSALAESSNNDVDSSVAGAVADNVDGDISEPNPAGP